MRESTGTLPGRRRSLRIGGTVPAVSIVIPCYNQSEFLPESVASVVNQTYMSWECIIVDDGSPDNTAEVAGKLIAAHPGKNIHLLRKTNGGLADARNTAIGQAKGRFILPLDADDRIAPDYLAETAAILDTRPDVAIVYVDEQNFGNAMHIHRKLVSNLQSLLLNNIHDYCSLYRREVWEKVGGYSPAMYLGGEDWNFWIGAAKHGFTSLRLGKPLFEYRNRENTMVAETNACLDEVRAHIVLHHPDFFGYKERELAEWIVAGTRERNREKLEKIIGKHPSNALLRRFFDLAGKRDDCAGYAPGKPAQPAPSPEEELKALIVTGHPALYDATILAQAEHVLAFSPRRRETPRDRQECIPGSNTKPIHTGKTESTGKMQQTIGILFSKDRAMQLDATLRSFFMHCRDANLVDLKVLYFTSNALHEQQYHELMREYGSVEFLKEDLFRSQVLDLLTRRETVLFLVDDNIFVRSFRMEDAVRGLAAHQDALGFSLRLGENTTYCYPLDAAQAVPPLAEISKGIVKYRWVGAEHDFGYPLELSSSIYRSEDLLALLKQVPFTNPNTLEATMSAHAQLYAPHRPALLCYEKSATFCNPVNKVQSIYPNRSGSGFEAEKLAWMFEEGHRIAVEFYEGFTPVGCHQEAELHFRMSGEKRPRVSVVIPVSDRLCAKLPDTVSSVLDQGFRDLEIVIVSQGGEAEARKAAELAARQHSGHPVRAMSSERAGRTAALNRGISEAKGVYVFPLDAGDAIAPDALESCVALLDANPNVSIAFTDALFISGDRSWRENAGEFEQRILMHANGLFPSALFRRFLWERTGGYRLDAGDANWDFWLTCSELGFQGRRIPEPFFFHNVDDGEKPADKWERDAENKARIALDHPGLFDNASRKQAEILLANSLMRWSEEERNQIGRMLEAASRAVSNRDLQAAATILAACVQRFPAYTGGYLALSDLLLGEEQIEGAAALLEAGVDVVSDAPVLLKRLGTIRFSQGDGAGAEKAFMDARENSPRDPDILLSLANITNGQERFAESLEYLTEASKIVPRDVDVWLGMALAADRVKDYDRAQVAFEKAFALDPEHTVVKKLARMSMEKGNKPLNGETAIIEDGMGIQPKESLGNAHAGPRNSSGGGLRIGQPASAARVNTSAPPLVSVIVPTFNRPAQLVEAVRSILAQTWRNFEVVVVNDAGVDVAPLVARMNTGNNISCIRHETNRGLAAARNTGIRAASGKYIAYLDDDDLFYPQHLETLVTFLEATSYKVAYSDAYRAHQALTDGKYAVTKRDLPYSLDFDYDRILVHNFIPVLCFVHEKSCLDESGLFDESMKVLEDWDLWIRISRKYRIAHIKQVTCEFSWREDGSTMSSAKHLDFVQMTEKIYGKYADHAAGRPPVLQARDERMRHLREMVRPLLQKEQPPP